MIVRRAISSLLRGDSLVRRGFCQIKDLEKKQPTEIPVHLRPYNKEKYEVPSTKIKYATGYALLDVEPMPRAKIMKLCYNILDKVKQTPEDSMYRIYTEEKIKYVMKLTDEIEDVRQLESELGNDSIELFIQALYKELDLVDYMKDSEPWKARSDDLEVYNLGRLKREDVGVPKFVRPSRDNTKVPFLP